MAEAERRYWDGYWADSSPTVRAATMTQILDRIKLDYLRPLLPMAGRTLEVGAGSGRLSCWLAMSGYRTVCLDYSVPALAAARANYAAAQVGGWFVTGDGFRLPFSDGAYDVVLSTGLLEHFEDPTPIVGEMVRVLRAGGLFYSDIVPKKFSLFRSLDWLGQAKRRLRGPREPRDTFYERSFTTAEIRTMLARCGLVDARVFPAGVVPPYLPLVYRSPRLRRLQVALVGRTRALWRRLDDTWLAEILGFYYFAYGRKPPGGGRRHAC